MARDFWTIHVWTATPGREAEVGDAWERMAGTRLDGMGGGARTLFRVACDARVHYTPMSWESREAYDAWRSGKGRAAMDALAAACERVEVVPLETARTVRR
jgi:heme-degrading monooxygenase HmoA